MRIILLICILLSTSTLFAQNKNSKTSAEKFKAERESEYENFKTKREAEFKKFKADYETAFEKFKKNYGQFLDEEEEVINLMSSNDNIPIKPISLKRNHRIESSATKEIEKIKIDRKILSNTKSSEFLPSLTDSKDDVEQLKEGIAKLDKINQAFDSAPKTQEVKATPVPAEKPKKEVVTPTTPIKEENIIPSGKPTNYVRISSAFGTRRHPINWKRHFHKGIDLTGPRMTPVVATADGVITYAKTAGGYGKFVKINHQNGYKTAYAHLHRISAKLNAKVKKGDVIGYLGSTGRSTGNHLHYEVYFQDKLIDPAKTL